MLNNQAQELIDYITEEITSVFDEIGEETRNEIDAIALNIYPIGNDPKLFTIKLSFDTGKGSPKKWSLSDWQAGDFATIGDEPDDEWKELRQNWIETLAEKSNDNFIEQQSINLCKETITALHNDEEFQSLFSTAIPVIFFYSWELSRKIASICYEINSEESMKIFDKMIG